jgi:serine/threonine protein kinase
MRAAGKLDHPAIVRTTDAGELQGIHFLVMEAIDGMDLSRIVRVEEKLSIADACEIVRQAAIGLAHAHEKGIVHRDVKPSNLMLDVNGQVRILDFGLAQVGLWDSGSAEITTVGQLMGTLDYMAPEQAERGGAVDYRADLYSLGATLFRLLTGRAPLAAAPNLTPLEKLRLLATHKPPKLRSLRGDVPEALSQIVDAMLSREPAQRPASATHAAELLEPFGSGAELIGLLSRAQSKPPVDETSFSINPLLQRDLASASPDRNMHPKQDRSEPWRDQLRVDQSNSRTGRLGRWLTGAALAGSFGMVCAGVLIILETSKGQLVIDSQADVQVKIVAIDESGKQSDVDELQISPGSKATRLKSGKYEIVLDSASDSFGVTNGAFTIRNGQIVVATITPKTNTANSEQIAQVNIGTRPEVVEDPRLNEVVYDGETLDTWLRRLKFERNAKEVERTLFALDALAAPSLQEVMLEPLVEFSSRTERSDITLPYLLKKVVGPALPQVATTILNRIEDEDHKTVFLSGIVNVLDGEASIGYAELLMECKKLLASRSLARQFDVAMILRKVSGRMLSDEFPAEVDRKLSKCLKKHRR